VEEDDKEQSQLIVVLVHRAIDSMVNKYDRKVVTALLSPGKSRSEQFQLGLTPTRAITLLSDLEERLVAWEASKTTPEDLDA
jgi:hypothetical protein